ncbi:MAG: hypothetical protein V1897_04035 [Pseudomonadota bacterium]
MKALLMLCAITVFCNAQQKVEKPTETIIDSIDVYSVVWTVDSIEYAGDKNVDHGWMQGHDWLDGISFVRDSLGQRVLPKICKKCFRKIYEYEHISSVKREADYKKLQKEMLKRKK